MRSVSSKRSPGIARKRRYELTDERKACLTATGIARSKRRLMELLARTAKSRSAHVRGEQSELTVCKR